MWAFKKEGLNWFGRIEPDDWLYLGTEVKYPKANPRNLGLYQPSSRLSAILFDSKDWVGEHGHWAHVLTPTANAESAYRLDRINTYDDVNFTFGFLQQAAHTADDNLALYLRLLIQDAEFKAFWPDLLMKDGHIHQKTPNGSLEDLEKAPAGTWKSTKLMAYLNEDRARIDEREKSNALKLIHLVTKFPRARSLQVQAAISGCKKKVAYWPDALADRVPDAVFALVLSQLHWRGGQDKVELRAMQNGPDPEKAILAFIASKDANRAAAIKSGLNKAKAAGQLGKMVYVKATKKFEPA